VRLIPRSRGGALMRFALGAVIVIGFATATTAVAGLMQFKQVATYLSQNKALRAPVRVPPPGAPQTLLLIGSDHRAGEPYSAANTDTMLLVRLNPSSRTINMLSIPRDLKVQIPGYGAQKINAAYSIGGPSLLLHIIQTQVFPGFQVNHILDINFGGFKALVNAIGCVYVDVDHRYYNNTALTDYSSIDIAPGYQKLCGAKALQFVRFRHTDSDIVRNARQQDFLRWVKDQYSISYLLANRDRLLRIFGEHVQTDADLHSVDGLINLFDLVVNMAGHEIKQIQFPYVFGPCNPVADPQTPCYVLAASAAAEQRAYQEFMAPTTGNPGPRRPISGAPGAGAHRAGAAGASSPASASRGGGSGGRSGVPGLLADPADGIAQAAALKNPGMPVYYPRYILAGSAYCSSASGNCDDPQEPASEYAGMYPREYVIDDRAGHPHAAYVLTLVQDAPAGEYYTVQGTTWQHPPILAHPAAAQVIDGKTLLEYFNGSRLDLVAWRTPEGVYWVSNSLTDSVGDRQLLAIAASLTRYSG
jgi:LCP family protein required for cell wall assembly